MSEEHFLEKQDLGNWWVLTELSGYLDETCLVLLVISIIFLEVTFFGAWLSLCSSQTNYNPNLEAGVLKDRAFMELSS